MDPPLTVVSMRPMAAPRRLCGSARHHGVDLAFADSGTPAFVGQGTTPVRPRNDVAQYDDLREEWWKPRGAFAMLHWIAAARASLVPHATHAAPCSSTSAAAPACSRRTSRTSATGTSAWTSSRGRRPSPAERGVARAVGDAAAVPLDDECADVVVAGEILEHVHDLDAVVAEATRILRPGGMLVIDTIASTRWGRFCSITIGERMPAGPPPRLHDAALFVDRDAAARAPARGAVCRCRSTGCGRPRSTASAG